MRQKSKLLNKLLTIVLTLMMVFSSVLVSKTNIVLAETNEEEKVQEELPEVKEEQSNPEELSPEVAVNPDEDKNEDETPTDVTTPEVSTPVEETTPEDETLVDGEENKDPEVVEEENETPMMVGMGTPVKTSFTSKITVTYKIGNKSIKKQYAKGSNIDLYSEAALKSDGYLRSDDSFAGWYYRDYGLLGLYYEEKEFEYNGSVSKNTVSSNITLYAKVIAANAFDTYFDFKVNNGRGSFVKEDSQGQEWSYYKYYKDKNGGLIGGLITAWKSLEDFTSNILEYEYVMTNDQVYVDILENSDTVNSFKNAADTNNDKVIDEDTLSSEYKSYAGQSYKLEENNDNTYTLTIGSYFTGTAFDIAIQEANENNEIVLLDDIYIVKPIEIWANIDFNLNDKSIIFNEQGLGLDILHHFDRVRSKYVTSDVIRSKNLCTAIYVNNAETKIYNGSIINLHSYGKGVVASGTQYFKTTLDDIEISVKTNQNAVEAGYYSLDDGANIIGIDPGYIEIRGGIYDGHVINNGEGTLTIYEGASFKYDPQYLLSTENKSNVTIAKGYKVWDDGNLPYKYIIGAEPVAKIGQKDYRTFAEALAAVQPTETITLLKDITLGDTETLTINKSCHINTNGMTIKNGTVEITSGKTVYFEGNGYVESKLNAEGNLNITSGHYVEIVKGNAGTINITGGYFALNIPESKGFYTSDYSCIFGDLPEYPYVVVDNAHKNQVELFKDGERIKDSDDESHYIDEYYPNLVQALNAINAGVVDADTIKVNRDILVQDIIKIQKPLTLDLSEGNVTTNVAHYDSTTTSKKADIYSIWINVGEGEKVTITGGKIVNESKLKSSETIYGIYVKSGNLDLVSTKLSMETLNCKTMYAIYNNSKESKINVDDSYILGDDTKALSTDLIYNKGTLDIYGYSWVESKASEITNSISTIENSGTLKVRDGAYVSVSGLGSNGAETIAIKSTGNVYVNDFDTTIVGTNEIGDVYGIYQESNTNEENREIIIDDNVLINIDNSRSENLGTISAGIYTEEQNDEDNGVTNIAVGNNVKIYVSSRETAYGIYSGGGNLFAGTHDGNPSNGEFNKFVNDETTNAPDKFDDSRYTEIKVTGNNYSYGVWCGYVEGSEVVSQLTNTVITMNTDDKNSFAVGSDSYGVNILEGYYSTGADNNLFDGTVYCFKGTRNYFNRDVSDFLYRALLCVEIDPITFNKNTYNYTIDGSNCGLKITVTNDSKLKVKAVVTFDPEMLLPENKDKYGVKFEIESLSEPLVYSINDSIKSKYNLTSDNDVDLKLVSIGNDTSFTYSFSIPAMNMGDSIEVYIVGLEKDENTNKYTVTRTIHSRPDYSVEQYYYNMFDATKHGIDMRNLAAAALRFGAEAQRYFGYKLDHLVDYKLSDFENYYDAPTSTTITGGATSVPDLDKLNALVNMGGCSLGLNGDITFTFEFNLKEGDSIDDFVFTSFTDPMGDGVEITSDHIRHDDNGRYYVDIANIPAKSLNVVYTLNICNETKDIDYDLVYSPINYMIAMVEKADLTSNKVLADLMNSLYQYYLIAKKFK